MRKFFLTISLFDVVWLLIWRQDGDADCCGLFGVYHEMRE
jgi:hypothetical protein